MVSITIHGHSIHILVQHRLISCHSIRGDHIHVRSRIHDHIHDHNIHSRAQHQRTSCHNIHGVHNHHIRSQYVHSHIHDHIHILAQQRQLAQHQQISCHNIHGVHSHIHDHIQDHSHDHSSHIQARQQPYPGGQEKQQPKVSCCQQ